MSEPFVRGHRKLELIRELAMQAAPQSELSAKYGCSSNTFTRFIKNHQVEIETARNAILNKVEDEASLLWVANKVNRIAEYQQDIEDINAQLDKGIDVSLLRQKHNALKAVAEELGSLPVRAAPTKDANTLTYTIEGVDVGALQ